MKIYNFPLLWFWEVAILYKYTDYLIIPKYQIESIKRLSKCTNVFKVK